MHVVEIRDLGKFYQRGTERVEALRGVSFSLPKGQFTSVMGPSGSGKSTLLQLLGGLDVPSTGKIFIDGTDISKFNDNDLTRFRRRKLGYVFQFFNLLPTLTALENVFLPRLLDGAPFRETKMQAVELLKKMGLEGRENHKPNELSGGQMQRVAIARALISNPMLILADEPTGNLDSKTGEGVLQLFRELVGEMGVCILMVTHDKGAAAYAHQLIQMKDGRVEETSRLC